jgi:hypothetical protein
MERELQDPVRGVVADLGGGKRRSIRVEALSSGSDHELADAVLGIGFPVRVLRCEPFVVVLVAAQREIHASLLERAPDVDHPRVVAVLGARREARVMPHRDGARRRVRGEVFADPLLLSRSGLASAGDFAAVAVDDDDVPGAEVVAVVPLLRISRGCSEVGVVG